MTEHVAGLPIDALMLEVRLRTIAARDAVNDNDLRTQHRLVDEVGELHKEVRRRSPDSWKHYAPLLEDEDPAVRLMAAGVVSQHDLGRAITVLEDLSAHAAGVVAVMASAGLEILHSTKLARDAEQ